MQRRAETGLHGPRNYRMGTLSSSAVDSHCCFKDVVIRGGGKWGTGPGCRDIVLGGVHNLQGCFQQCSGDYVVARMGSKLGTF